MSIFQTIDSSDINHVRFFSNKQWNDSEFDFYRSNYNSDSINLHDTNTNLTASNGYYDYLLHETLESKFYSDNTDTPHYNIWSDNRQYRSLYSSAGILTTSQSNYGLEIKPGSLIISSSTQPEHVFVDDSYGNLIDTHVSSSNEIYNLFEEDKTIKLDLQTLYRLPGISYDFYSNRFEHTNLLWDNSLVYFDGKTSYSRLSNKQIESVNWNLDWHLCIQFDDISTTQVDTGSDYNTILTKNYIKSQLVDGGKIIDKSINSNYPIDIKFTNQNHSDPGKLYVSFKDQLGKHELTSQDNLSSDDIISVQYNSGMMEFYHNTTLVDSASVTGDIHTSADLFLGSSGGTQEFWSGSISQIDFNTISFESSQIESFHELKLAGEWEYHIGNVFYRSGTVCLTSQNQYVMDLIDQLDINLNSSFDLTDSASIYYELVSDNTSGSIIYDLSTNSNDGTITSITMDSSEAMFDMSGSIDFNSVLFETGSLEINFQPRFLYSTLAQSGSDVVFGISEQFEPYIITSDSSIIEFSQLTEDDILIHDNMDDLTSIEANDGTVFGANITPTGSEFTGLDYISYDRILDRKTFSFRIQFESIAKDTWLVNFTNSIGTYDRYILFDSEMTINFSNDPWKINYDFKTGEKYDLIYTYDGTTEKIYVNQVFVDSRKTLSYTFECEEFYIGSLNASNELKRFSGNVYEWTYFSYALDETDVSQVDTIEPNTYSFILNKKADLTIDMYVNGTYHDTQIANQLDTISLSSLGGANSSSTFYSGSISKFRISSELLSSNQIDYINLSDQTDLNLNYKSTKMIDEYMIRCEIPKDELTHTTNPTSRDKQIPGEYDYKSSLQSDDFNPYITTIGLYNDNLDLIAVAKTSQPIQRLKNNKMTFNVRIDF